MIHWRKQLLQPSLSTPNRLTGEESEFRSVKLPSKLSPRPCPRHSGETAKAATSPLLSSKKGNSAAQAIMEPSLSTTVYACNSCSSCKKEENPTLLDVVTIQMLYFRFESVNNLLLEHFCLNDYKISIPKVVRFSFRPSTFILHYQSWILMTALRFIFQKTTFKTRDILRTTFRGSTLRQTCWRERWIRMPFSSRGRRSCSMLATSLALADRVPSYTSLDQS